jgi:heme oxygenase-like protein
VHARPLGGETRLLASARLGRKVELVLPAYGAPLARLLEHPRADVLYPRCLIVSYHISRSMVPLMEAALAHARALGPGDPVAAGLAAYLEHHIPEEMHDDVPGDAVVDDLAALGLDPVEVRALPTTPQIAALIAAQLAWMSEDHPVAILGFLELEAHNADRATVERLIAKTGLPREGFGQLLLHSKLDLVHAKELHRVIDALPLEAAHEQLIGLSALHTMSLVTEAFLDAIGEAEPVTVATRS